MGRKRSRRDGESSGFGYHCSILSPHLGEHKSEGAFGIVPPGGVQELDLEWTRLLVQKKRGVTSGQENVFPWGEFQEEVGQLSAVS